MNKKIHNRFNYNDFREFTKMRNIVPYLTEKLPVQKEQTLTSKEVAALFNISLRTLQRRLDRGLRYSKTPWGNRYLFSDVKNFLTEMGEAKNAK